MANKYLDYSGLQELVAKIKSLIKVTGVKGNAESTYRTGNVNLTAANVGAAAASHTHPAENITEGYLNIHPENSPVIIPFMHNDIAHLLKRGGSAVVKYDGVTKSVDISNVFDGSGSYWVLNPSGITNVVIELTTYRIFTWTNSIYVDFGSASWRPKSVKIEVMNSNYANDVWTQKYSTTTNALGHVVVKFSHTPVGASNAGGGFNKIRFTFSDWQTATIFRISQLGIYYYGSAGLRETYMSRGDDDDLFRSITPHENNVYSLGTSSKKWKEIHGTLKGNADSATTASSATNASKVNNHTVDADVPSGAVFTDSKVTQELYAENYNLPLLMAYPSNQATDIDITNIAFRNNSIYANPSTGKVTATDFVGTINGHSVNKDVPSNAVFTDNNTIPSAYCTTAAGTAAKTASLTNYTLLDKSYVFIVIKNANTYDGALTLNINGKGAKTIYINGKVSSSSNKMLPAGTYLVYYASNIYYFRTDGKITGNLAGVADTATTASNAYSVNGHTVNADVPAGAFDVVSSSKDGLCPQLPSGAGQSKYLCEDGTWRQPATYSSGIQQFYDDTISNASSDWSNRRCSVYKVSGNGFINISASIFQNNNTSYGNIDIAIQHSVDNGTTWTTDAYSSHRHDSNQGNVRDALSINYSKVAVNNELLRVTWYLSKEDSRTTRITIIGDATLTITRTIDGGASAITLP